MFYCFYVCILAVLCVSMLQVLYKINFIYYIFSPQVPFFLFIIFTVYTMLPFQLLHAVVLSVISSVSHILALTVHLTVYSDTHSPYLANQVEAHFTLFHCRLSISLPALIYLSFVQLLSSALVFVCGIVVGAFHKVLMEKTLRQTFQDTLRCLSMRMKLEIEKRQQVSGSLRVFSHQHQAEQLQPIKEGNTCLDKGTLYF